MLRKLYGFLDGPTRLRVFGLLLSFLVSSALESVGIVLVFSLFKVVVDPAVITQYSWLARFKALTGAQDSGEFLAMLCVALLALFLVKAVVQVVVLYVRQRVEMTVRLNLGATLLAIYLRSPYAMHLRRTSSELTRNVNTNVSICSLGIIALADLASDAILTGMVGLTLIWLEPGVTIAAIAVFGIIGSAYLVIGRRYFRGWGHASNVAAEAMYRMLTESLIGVKQIKTLGVEGFFTASYAAAMRRFGILNLMNSVAQQSLKPIFEFITMATLLVPMIVLLLRDVPAAGIVPVLVMFAAAALRVLPSLVRSAGILQNLRFSEAAIESVRADLGGRVPTELTPAPRLVDQAISLTREFRLEAVSAVYEGATRPALDGVTMTIERGQSVAIIGASGAGKTTLVDMMLGLIAPTQGRLMVDGTALPPGAPHPRLFGYVPQDCFIVNDTLRRNIALGIADRDIDEDRVGRALAAASLGDFVANLPGGLDAVVGDRGMRLSGGQRQRLAIARALYDDPEILVLDEATSALDPVTEAEVAASVQTLRGRKTLIIVAHRLSTVKHCDCLFLLKAGRLAESGTFEELYRRNAEFREMVAKMSLVGAPGALSSPQAGKLATLV